MDIDFECANQITKHVDHWLTLGTYVRDTVVILSVCVCVYEYLCLLLS